MDNTTPYSEGDPDAPICVVVEAPAKWEMIKSRPLVGESGRVFEECLHAAGLIRREIQIVNVSRKPIKGVDSLLGKGGNFTPEGQEVLDDFKGRLQARSPRVLIPMGNLALAACHGESGITKWRGSPLRPTGIHEGAWSIPTFHPASTLPGRGPFTNRYSIVSDIKKAKRYADDPDVAPPERNLHIHPTFSEADSYLTQLDGDDHTFGFDIEVLNFQVSCISFSHDPMYAMSIPFVGDVWSEEDEARIWRSIAALFSNPRCTAVAHNAMFDVSFLYLQNAIRILNKIHCTMVMHRILYPDFPASLQFVTSNYTDEPYYKDDKQIWQRPWEDPDRFYKYNCRDSAVCIEAYYPLAEEIYNDVDYHWTYENTMSMFEPCLYMMARGVLVDTVKLNEVKTEVQGTLDEKEAELNDVAEQPFNPGSPKQCIQYFYGVKGIKPYINRKTSNPTCDDKALARIVRRFNLPEARLTQEIRGLRKLRDTYLNMVFDKDGRLRCTYDPRGTASGRLSSKKTIFGTGLNMQNLHPKFKGFITTDGE